MAETLPYMIAYSRLTDILAKIRAAQTPERFTPDFLSTKLGFSQSSDKAAITLLKRMGFISSEGVPTSRYSQFRNTSNDVSGSAMAEGMRAAYAELYARNEFAHHLKDKDLQGLVVQITGAAPSAPLVKRVVSTFRTLNSFAHFDGTDAPAPEPPPARELQAPPLELPAVVRHDSLGMNLSYTINLNLPATSDTAVFNAIFTALRDNLLRGLK